MSKQFRMLVATAVILASGSFITAAAVADTPAPADSAKLSTGLSPLAQLLDLMDTDKNGKVSKAEFMRYMEAEFDFADANKDGQLDPAELKTLLHRLSHPANGLPKVRK